MTIMSFMAWILSLFSSDSVPKLPQEPLKRVKRERPKPPTRDELTEFAIAALRELKELKIRKAEIIAALDDYSTELCLKQNGKKYLVTTALKKMPLPHPEQEGKSCRCCWVGVFE